MTSLAQIKKIVHKKYSFEQSLALGVEDDDEYLIREKWHQPIIKTTGRKSEFLFKKEIFNFLIKSHKIFYNHCGKPYEKGVDNEGPLLFLLGQKNNIVNKVVLMDTVFGEVEDDGCGEMSDIPEATLNVAIYNLMAQNSIPIGIARVGAFDELNIRTANAGRGKFGYGIINIAAQLNGHKFFFLSIGCWDITMHSCNKNGNFVTTNFKIINSKNKKRKVV